MLFSARIIAAQPLVRLVGFGTDFPGESHGVSMRPEPFAAERYAYGRAIHHLASHVKDDDLE